MQIKDLVEKVKKIELRVRKQTEALLVGQYHSAFKGQGIAFSEVRPYQFGDDVRDIDWNKTARFQEPFVKLMEEEREQSLILLVDISSSMNYGTKVQLKRELVTEMCASLALSALGNHDQVGLVLFADKIYDFVPPKKGRKHILGILSKILNADPIDSTTHIDLVLEHSMNVFKKRSLIFLFSDFEDEFRAKILQVVTRKHQLFGVKISDPIELYIPNIGCALFQDVETKKTFWANTSNPEWRKEYETMRIENLNHLKGRFKEHSAQLIHLSSGEDYIKPLYHCFQRK